MYFCRLNAAPEEMPILHLTLKNLQKKVCQSHINHEGNHSSCRKRGCCFLLTLCWFCLGRQWCKRGLCSCKSAFQGPLGAHYFEKHSLAWLFALSVRLVDTSKLVAKGLPVNLLVWKAAWMKLCLKRSLPRPQARPSFLYLTLLLPQEQQMFVQQTNNVDDKANWPFLEQTIWSTFLGQFFFFFWGGGGSIFLPKAAWLHIYISSRGD